MSSNALDRALDPAFVLDFAARWAQGWAARDGEAVAALCTEDVEFTDPALGTVHGRAAVSQWVRACALAFPDYRFDDPDEPPYLAPDRPKAIIVWRMLGTNTGPIDPPGFAPTNRSFVIDGVDQWWFRDGLLARCRADWDLNGLLRQLGLAPRPGSPAERAMVLAQRAVARISRR
jgi:steroid delta-isomerase-like uncharacterized protein